ncbi:anthranilate synthase component II [Halosolutus gelatinilyticus]|uniref:anthranilate synthase component II n=1 Tax=Halosolutus gelatinilyticus TaxID=2931975 RepID=UPI001FF645B2|nr:aminodeoxychorismate/anthranilate synthase component II [Halosolutus gelatinilyticus]
MREVAAGSETGGSVDARILVIDNYDSFAYNLVQYVGEVADEVIVRRNDAIDLAGVRDLDPTGIVVSPGPGTPEEAGISIPLFAETEYPILGVCLGHQALCAANGAPVVHAPEVVHGKPSVVSHDGDGIFAGLPADFRVGRYHSLAVDRDDLPASLAETARTTDDRGVLMAVRHRENPHVGVQFHPESILTRARDEAAGGDGISLALGKRMIANFCRLAADERSGGTGGAPPFDRQP